MAIIKIGIATGFAGCYHFKDVEVPDDIWDDWNDACKNDYIEGQYAILMEERIDFFVVEIKQ